MKYVLMMLSFLGFVSLYGNEAPAAAPEAPSAAPEAPSAAPDAPSAAPDAPVAAPAKEKEGAVVKSIPRHEIFPISEDQMLQQFAKEHQQARFLVYIFCSSANTKSDLVLGIFNSFYEELLSRNVFLHFVASHDNEASMKNWHAKHQFKPSIHLASLELIDILDNPMVPSIYVVNHKGHLVWYKGMPTKEDTLRIVKDLVYWTDF